MDEMQELQGFFVEEANELFENSRNILLKAEEEKDLQAEEINALFRDIHTLKGGSGSVELNLFASYVHYLEDFIDKLRDQEVKPNPQIIDFLIEELDCIENLLEEEIEGELTEEKVEKLKTSLIDQITQIIEGKDDNTSVSQEEIQEENIDNELGDAAEKYSAQLIDLIDEVSAALSSAQKSKSFGNSYVDRLFRHIHTLKGTASFIGFHALPTYLHGIENLLNDARNNDITYTDEINTLITESMQTVQEIANDEINATLDQEYFQSELKKIEQALAKIIEKHANDKIEECGYEIFDTPQEVEQGFMIFGDEEEKPQTDTTEKKEQGFVIFDTPQEVQKQEVQKQEVQKQEVQKQEPTKEKKNLRKLASSNSIRVGLDKIDFLMNRVGDLVITKSMLYKFLEDLSIKIEDPSIVDKLDRLEREIRELQEAVMSVRMIPMESVYSKLPKTIRDLAKKLDKKVNFIHTGDSVEIDKMMIEGLTDPLMHIIRNSLDHGIEMPQVRRDKGKNEVGLLEISAAHEGGYIVITIKDDGAGINLEKVTQKALQNGVITQ